MLAFKNRKHNNSKKNFYRGLILLAVVCASFICSMPAYAAVERVVAEGDKGKIYQYNYEELVDSYALRLLGRPNGLYDHFQTKKVIALKSGDVYYDFASLEKFFQQASDSGKLFNIKNYMMSNAMQKANLPSVLIDVTFDNHNREVVTKHVAIMYGETGSHSENVTDLIADRTTLIIGKPTVPLAAAKRWAEARGADQRFIAVASLYWQFGGLTGIRPEVLYAQSAYETNYGRFTGIVSPAYNNWAGIKIANPEGDRPEDHEKFSTPEEGVRAHFNHMAAYIGIKTLGEPHGRYHVVNRLNWAGSVKTVEELSGKWAPSATYHVRIVEMVTEMQEYSS